MNLAIRLARQGGVGLTVALNRPLKTRAPADWVGMSNCGHDHSIDRVDQHRNDGGRLLAAFLVIIVFMVVEVIGGLISGSLALIADAGHMLTDALALMLALSAHRLSTKPADDRLHFGYRRMQVLAAFVNGIALTALMVWIVYEAVRRSINPVPVEWAPMLAVAAAGLAANAVAFRLLHRAGDQNINIKGAMLHVASDLLGSIAAIIAAIVIWQTGWTRIDPILSIVVASLIGYSAFKLLKETSHILLEGAPLNIDKTAITADLALASADIEDIHSVRIWQMTPDHPSLTLHAKIRSGAAAGAALQAIKDRLEKRYGIRESTIQIELDCGCPDDQHQDTEEKSASLVTMHPRASDGHHHRGGHAHDDNKPRDGKSLKVAGGTAVSAIQSIFK